MEPDRKGSGDGFAWTHASCGHGTVVDRLIAAGESEDVIIVVWLAIEAEAAVEDQEGAKHGGDMMEVVRGC